MHNVHYKYDNNLNLKDRIGLLLYNKNIIYNMMYHKSNLLAILFFYLMEI